MGKTEYEAVGGELSFPVVSLRENLIIVMLDAEGKEILRTEFRTLLLMEQGHWDNLFPLKNGGSVHVKLQFLLSDEDRKRIHEVRDAALKKRLVRNAGTKILGSFSDNKIEDSITRTVAEVKGMVLERSDPTDPGECGSAPGNPLPHVSEQFSENLVQRDSHDLIIIRDKRRLDCSQSSLHSKSAENSSCMSNDQEEHKYLYPKSKDMQSKDLNNNIKKMISAFESNTYQDVRSFSQSANLRRTNLVTRVSPNSAVPDGRHLKFPQAMSNSFSAGMLLERGSKESKKHVDSHFVQKIKETQNFVIITSSDTLKSKKQLHILKNDKMIQEVDSCTKETLPDTPYSVASNCSMATEDIPKMSDTSKESKKYVDSHFVQKNKEAQNSVSTTSSDILESKKQLHVLKNDKMLQKLDSCTKDTLRDTPYSAASNPSMATEDVPKMCDSSKESKKHVDSHFFQKNKKAQNSVIATSSDTLESKKQLHILKNDKLIQKLDSCTKDTLPDTPYSVASNPSMATEDVPKTSDTSKESKRHVDSHFVQKNKEAQNSVSTTSSDTLESKKQLHILKNDKLMQKDDSCTEDILPDTPYSAAFNRSMATDNVPKMSNPKESTGLNISVAAGSEFVLDEKSSSTMPTLMNYEAVGGKLNSNPMHKGGGSQDTDARYEAFQEMPSSSSGKLESICEHNGEGKKQQKEIFDGSKRIEDPNDMPIHQKGTSIVIARKVCDETVLSGLSLDIVPANSYGKASAWIYSYSSLCPVGILGFWTPRRLCITTGSKLLRDFVDSCAVTSVATSVESSLIIEANTQQNKHNDICIKTKEVKLLRSPRNSYMEDFLDSLKSTRGMIEQGGWIVVVIVACGLLLIGR